MGLSVRTFNQVAPRFGARVWVDPAATVIGAVVLDEDVSVWPNVVLRGDVNSIEIGARSNIQDGVIGHVTHDGPYTPGGLPLIVGADVTVGHAAVLHACTIGDRCLVGMGALVLDGAELESEVMLAAGSLVSPGKRLESGWLYRGRPAEAVRRLTDRELEMLGYSAQHYVRLKNTYLTEGVEGAGNA
ncbi:gamma carbonic anhydrase family protein [Guyparkeria sp.]|uniref:gamma carbonic anhydrase family protein n=1 Tax=Guyparkeria sp. TaxID=2035736 RepID=UPI0039709234